MAKDRRYQKIQLDVSQRTFDQLNRLQSQIDASSRAEVVRKALYMLDWLVSKINEGSEIMTKRVGTDELVSIEFPLLYIHPTERTSQ
ncbi:MAG: hypothetical protein Q8Q94_02035 [bacterium]|nr:hypothetical protein [bacterium]